MIQRHFFRFVLLCGFVFCHAILNAQAGDPSILSVPKTTVSPEIDGQLDPVWHMVAKNKMLAFYSGEGLLPPGPWPDLFTQFRIMWDDDYLYLFGEVTDEWLYTQHSNIWERDGFELYFDGDNSKNSMAEGEGYDANDVAWRYIYGEAAGNPGAPNATHAFSDTDHGYNVEIQIPQSDLTFDLEKDHVFGHEWQYNDNDGVNRESIAKWWSSSNDTWRDPSLFGTARLGDREVASVLDVRKTNAPPVIDGAPDAVWETAPEIPFNTYVEDSGSPIPSLTGWDDLDMTFQSLWDAQNLYVFVSVIDNVVATPTPNEYANDGIELSFDGDNSKNDRNTGYDVNDRRYTFVYGGTPNGSTPPNAQFAWNRTGEGYDFEIRIPAQDLTFPLTDQHVYGFEVQINDNDGGDREHIAKWWSSSDATWLDPSLFGTAQLIVNTLSQVLMTSPSRGAAFLEGDAVSISAEVFNNESAVSSVTFLVDDQQIAQDSSDPYSATWTAAIPGAHVLRAAARLASGMTLNSSPVTIRVNGPEDAVSVSIVEPQTGALFQGGDAIQITAQLTDPAHVVNRVNFRANDVLLGYASSPPYTFLWESPPAGSHVLKASAQLNSGTEKFSEPVTVGVESNPTWESSDPVLFSFERGFYTAPFDVTMNTETEGTTIRYTLDGSDPVSSATAFSGLSPVSVHIDPDSDAGRGRTPAVTLRARAFQAGKNPGEVVTQTYIFIHHVRNQTYPGGDWPGGVKDQQLDYDMDLNVTNDPRYKDQIETALLDIPTFSVVTDLANLFSPDSGIYVNAQFHGEAWERPCSVELIHPDGAEGFATNAGLRIRGGWSRHGNNPKHAFRLLFKDEYGDGKLDYPLFGDEGVDQFDKIDLRTSQNYSWSFYGDPYQTMTRDVFSRDLQGEMGMPYTRSRFYHLYLDGLYMGIFQTQERSEASFAEQYLGGARENWDVVKVDIGDYWQGNVIEATDGNTDAWQAVWDACLQGFQTDATYYRLQGRNADGSLNPAYSNLVDIDNLIDYMLIIFYTGNFDAPVSKFGDPNRNPNNFYAMRDRTGNKGFIFLANDSEHTLLQNPVSPGVGVYENRVFLGYEGGDWMYVDRFEKFHPQWLHFKLTDNAEYRMKFADHVLQHLFHGGAMTPDRSVSRFQRRADEIDLAIIAESARWGDSRAYPARTKDDDWIPAVNGVINEFFPPRTNIVIDQLKAVGLYPNIDPPIFVIQAEERWEEKLIFASAQDVTLRNPQGQTGTMYVTLDGGDPRAIGGSVSASAQSVPHQGTLSLTGTAQLSARIKVNDQWSALHRISIGMPGDFGGLRITEIHYHPADNGAMNDGEYEFVELKNTGASPLNLSFLSFSDGIEYTFPAGASLPSGGFVVLASNSAEFENRYGFAPFGEYSGQLNNGGEKVTLVDAAESTIFSFTYDDGAPWPTSADGEGYSLVPADTNPTGSPDDPAYWKSSKSIHGSPGQDDGVTSSVTEDNSSMVSRFALYQNSPNPFNPTTVIRFDLPEKTFVTISVYDILGRRMDVPIRQTLDAGAHSVRWDGSRFAAGVYVYELTTPSYSKKCKMLLMK